MADQTGAVDWDVLKRAVTASPLMRRAPVLRRDLLAALDRAEEVADQGCEFCENAVDDLGEERDGGREPHAHWWACGRCWNESAAETSTVIGHLSELLDRALERIPELERRLDEAIDQNMRQAVRLERAERVEAAARVCLDQAFVGNAARAALRAALAPVPDRSDG